MPVQSAAWKIDLKIFWFAMRISKKETSVTKLATESCSKRIDVSHRNITAERIEIKYVAFDYGAYFRRNENIKIPTKKPKRHFVFIHFSAECGVFFLFMTSVVVIVWLKAYVTFTINSDDKIDTLKA